MQGCTFTAFKPPCYLLNGYKNKDVPAKSNSFPFLCTPMYMYLLLLLLALQGSFFFLMNLSKSLNVMLFSFFVSPFGVLLFFVCLGFCLFFSRHHSTKKFTSNHSFSVNYFLLQNSPFLKWKFLVTALLTISFFSGMHLQLSSIGSDFSGICGVQWSFCLFSKVLSSCVSVLGLLQGYVCYWL